MTKFYYFTNRLVQILPNYRQFLNNNQGVAAIEFAFIAPLLIILYFGLSETSMALREDRKVAQVANVVGDLATQQKEMSKEDITNILNAAIFVMGVNAANNDSFYVEVTSYEKDENNNIINLGTAKLGSSNSSSFDPSKLSSEFLNKDSGAIVVRVEYLHKPVTFHFMDKVILSETHVMKPRLSSSVPFIRTQNNTKTSFRCNSNSTSVSCKYS